MQSWLQLSALMSPLRALYWHLVGFINTLRYSRFQRYFGFPFTLWVSEKFLGNHGLQFSPPRTPWWACVWHRPQWDPLMLWDPFGFSSDLDSWKGLCNLLSGPEVQGLSTKCTTGLTGIKQVLTNLGSALISLWSSAVHGKVFNSSYEEILQRAFRNINYYFKECLL